MSSCLGVLSGGLERARVLVYQMNSSLSPIISWFAQPLDSTFLLGFLGVFNFSARTTVAQHLVYLDEVQLSCTILVSPGHLLPIP